MTRCSFLLLALLTFSLRAEDAPYKIICFGDSITEGKTPASLKNGERWIEVLEKSSGGKIVCYNEGKGGRPASAFPDFEPALKRHPEANVLLIALGTNDSRDYSKSAVQELRKNMNIMACFARGKFPNLKKIILCAPYNISVSSLKTNREKGTQRMENLMAFGKTIKEIATQENHTFIDFYGVIPETSLTTDGVHPDAAGHAAIAAKAWAELQKVLK